MTIRKPVAEAERETFYRTRYDQYGAPCAKEVIGHRYAFRFADGDTLTIEDGIQEDQDLR